MKNKLFKLAAVLSAVILTLSCAKIVEEASLAGSAGRNFGLSLQGMWRTKLRTAFPEYSRK